MVRTAYNPVEMDKPLNVVGNDIYFEWQDAYDGWKQTFQGDLARSLKHRNFFVAETDAQTTEWDATRQLPPYDGQMYQDVFGDVSNGANLISYWHWTSIHGGQEIYWKGVLSHDLEPNRAYAEVSRVGNDLKRIGPKLVDLKRSNDVGILYSIDSNAALGFMSYVKPTDAKVNRHADSYLRVVEQLHAALYKANVGTDIVYAEEPDFSRYKLLIVPALYVADDALLQKISDYVRAGGHVVMTYKSGAANADNLIRWERAPGPLRDAAGISYQETSTLLKPLALKGDPFGMGDDNKVSTIAEFLQLGTAKPLAYYDHPFFGQWPAITRNSYGKGTVLYEGTELSDPLQAAILGDELKKLGLWGADQQLPAAIRIKYAISKTGRPLHFLFNYSPSTVTVRYDYSPATDLLTGHRTSHAANVALPAWGVAIMEE